MGEDPTYASELTSRGRGAIAVVVVVGPRVGDILERCFQPAASHVEPSALESNRLYFGRWNLGSGLEEELIVVRVSKRMIEINCHGGTAVVDAILRDAGRAGCHVTPWQKLVSIGVLDPIQRPSEPARTEAHRFSTDAAIDLSQATTMRTTSILLDQYHGALDRAYKEAQDYRSRGDQGALTRLVDRIRDTCGFGLHLVRPWEIVISGPPNAGKSSLLNALVGFERTVTFDQPGTTRDVVTETTAFGGWPVQLRDTAGLRPTADPLEQMGVARARLEIQEADLNLLVIPFDRVERQIIDGFRSTAKETVLVVNKCDLQHGGDDIPTSDSAVRVSARTGEGLPTLIKTVLQRLVPDPPERGDPVAFRQQHRQAFEQLLPTE